MTYPLVRPARGVSLVELLIGMVIALMVLGIALQLTLIARQRYLRLADEALMEDRGMQALELIRTAVEQAGWITDTPATSLTRRWPDKGDAPSLAGMDNCGGPHMLPTFGCRSNGERGSDALLVRFAGRSTRPDGKGEDGATRDCSGRGIPERIDGASDPRLGYMMLYVSESSIKDASGRGNELQLMCRSLTREFTGAPKEPTAGYGMVRGIDTLQLLYTVATRPGVAMSASDMQPADWRQVQQVHVAVVIRGDLAIRPPEPNRITLFPGLSAQATNQDIYFTPTDPRRNRRLFNATLIVRNPLYCEVDAC